MQGLQAPDHILRTTELQKTFPETPFGVKLYTPKLQVKLNEDFTSQLNVLPECSVFPPHVSGPKCQYKCVPCLILLTLYYEFYQCYANEWVEKIL